MISPLGGALQKAVVELDWEGKRQKMTKDEQNDFFSNRNKTFYSLNLLRNGDINS